MSKHIYFASGVLRTLLHISFDVVRSAVRVESSPGYVIRLPPAVIGRVDVNLLGKFWLALLAILSHEKVNTTVINLVNNFMR